MAGAGKFGAYRTQPTNIPDRFAGEEQIARIARYNIEKRDAERQEQLRLKEQADIAINNAIDAGNVDMSSINEAMHGLLYKKLDYYGEQLVDAMDALNRDPSSKNKLALKQVTNKFNSDINSLRIIGSKIKSVADNRDNLDPLYSAEPINGISNFLYNIPKYVDKYDPATNSIDGTNINDMFNSMVDMSKLTPKIDADGEIGDFVNDLFEGQKQNKTTVVKGGKEYTSYDYEYDENDARAKFKQRFEGSKAAGKKKYQILKQYENADEQQRLRMQRYVTVSDKGIMVTDDGLFNYIQDNDIDPVANTISMEPVTQPIGRQVSSSEQAKIDRNNALFGYINDLFANDGNNLGNEPITVNGRIASLQGGGTRYNPKTKKKEAYIKYKYKDEAKGGQPAREMVFTPEEARQTLGNMLGGSFDYNTILRERQNTDPNYKYPDINMDYETRVSGSQTILEEDKNEALTAINSADPANNEEDMVMAGIQSFLDKKYGVGTDVSNAVFSKLETITPGSDVIAIGKWEYDLDNPDHREDLARDLSYISALTQQLFSEGLDANSIDEEINNVINRDRATVELSIEPIERTIINLGIPPDKRAQYNKIASDMISDGASDEEVIAKIKEVHKSGVDKTISNINSNISTELSQEDEDILASFINSKSAEEVKAAEDYYKENFGNNWRKEMANGIKLRTNKK